MGMTPTDDDLHNVIYVNFRPPSEEETAALDPIEDPIEPSLLGSLLDREISR